ncbi:MAG TPA: TrkH family potassium uptake protein [Bacteroidales bacterium]|nr:TrkH family potassium uptake protein [Bacteroidales bacterium]HPJ60319.1 TrkH family potassium uptake protein [Bacteroidales bacterium]HPR13402.1 TrkH family potassium uptake protein [Bacteroidales bacterium]HRW86420.1 TrkH family potassium uptake protein [Bacteroidales bacterium]
MKLINPLIILRFLGPILLIETAAFILCILVAAIYGEDLVPFIWAAVISAFLWIAIKTGTINTDIGKTNKRDGFLAVSFSWILFSVVGVLPYMFSGTIPSFIDAFFETASGVTTTGATIIRDVEILPFSILFWRSLTHWIGGLGIIVLVIIILPSLKITGQQLFSLESSLKEKIHPKTKAIGFRIMFVYVGLTIAEVILLCLGDMTLFDSVCHSFGTIATGGFSTRNTSIMFYSNYSQYIIAIFMFLAGVSFVVYYYTVKLQFSKVRKNEELRFYTIVTVVAGFFVSAILFLQSGKPPETAFREGFFQVISFITTTGYATSDYLLWPESGMLLMFLLLFSGASTGSSTGNIKMARHLMALKNITNTFKRMIHSNIINPVRISGKPIEERSNTTVISFILLYFFLFILGTFIITLTGPDLITSASAVAASIGNVGPGFGQAGPMFNYSAMPEISKIVFSLLMIIGRLEILTVLALFSKSFWRI